MFNIPLIILLTLKCQFSFLQNLGDNGATVLMDTIVFFGQSRHFLCNLNDNLEQYTHVTVL